MDGSGATNEPRQLSCPFCDSYTVDRLYLASAHLDTCECHTCGARWDEEEGTGAYRGRASRSSVLSERRC